MGVAEKFKKFNENIRISSSNVDSISYRYKRITKQLNKDFWDNESDTSHSLFVGSYGRDTDIYVSDIDMLFRLPYSVYEQYNNYNGNGQSALLQAVRVSLQKTYNTSHIKGDGQIIGINFEDGINFEIVPCFINKDESYTYPDSNDGGSWKTTNPKPEIEAIRKVNNDCNGNLKNLCRMSRVWKDEWNLNMGGLLIDTLAYNFIKDWSNKDKSFLYYDWLARDFFGYLKNLDKDQTHWLSPGSNQYVWKKDGFQYKATQSYNLAVEAVDYEASQQDYSADQKWKEIFGSKFTG